MFLNSAACMISKYSKAWDSTKQIKFFFVVLIEKQGKVNLWSPDSVDNGML